MSDNLKVAISLPRKLARRVERLRKQTGENRSEIVRRALALLLAQGERERRIREYVEGYQRMPETAAEVAAADASAAEALAGEPWA